MWRKTWKEQQEVVRERKVWWELDVGLSMGDEKSAVEEECHLRFLFCLSILYLHLVLSVNFFQSHLLHLVFFWTNMLTFFLVIIFMSF